MVPIGLDIILEDLNRSEPYSQVGSGPASSDNFITPIRMHAACKGAGRRVQAGDRAAQWARVDAVGDEAIRSLSTRATNVAADQRTTNDSGVGVVADVRRNVSP